MLAFAKEALQAPLRLARGVVHVEQPRASLAAIKRRVETFDAWALAALHVLTGLTGSALLALAVALKDLTPEEAWAAAHVDEDWQISHMGRGRGGRRPPQAPPRRVPPPPPPGGPPSCAARGGGPGGAPPPTRSPGPAFLVGEKQSPVLWRPGGGPGGGGVHPLKGGLGEA